MIEHKRFNQTTKMFQPWQVNEEMDEMRQDQPDFWRAQ
jgi:hypothetical protein